MLPGSKREEVAKKAAHCPRGEDRPADQSEAQGIQGYPFPAHRIYLLPASRAVFADAPGI